MKERAPIAEHHEAPARDGAEELEEPQVAGSVDARGSDHGEREIVLALERESELLALALRLLIDVARHVRPALVRRGVGDVAVHAHRADVHEAAHALRARRLEEVPRAVHVHLAVAAVPDAGLAKRRGEMKDHFATARRSGHGAPVGDVAFDQLDVGGEQRAGARRVTGQHAHAVAGVDERAHQMRTGESRASRDQYPLHQHSSRGTPASSAAATLDHTNVAS